MKAHVPLPTNSSDLLNKMWNKREELSKMMKGREESYNAAKMSEIRTEGEIEILQIKLNRLLRNLESKEAQLSSAARESKELEKYDILTQMVAARTNLRLFQVSINAYEDLKKQYNLFSDKFYDVKNTNRADVDPEDLSGVRELWTLLKSAALRPPLTSFDPLLRTITLPNHVQWPLGDPNRVLFVRRAHGEMVRDVMERYRQHCQLENHCHQTRYGCIIKGTPGIGTIIDSYNIPVCVFPFSNSSKIPVNSLYR